VEPLDANGISNRDKAIIAELSGGGAGGVTMNVYAAPDMDVNALANVVGQRLGFTMRKGGR
jgi:hypothetical protein